MAGRMSSTELKAVLIKRCESVLPRGICRRVTTADLLQRAAFDLGISSGPTPLLLPEPLAWEDTPELRNIIKVQLIHQRRPRGKQVAPSSASQAAQAPGHGGPPGGAVGDDGYPPSERMPPVFHATFQQLLDLGYRFAKSKEYHPRRPGLADEPPPSDEEDDVVVPY